MRSQLTLARKGMMILVVIPVFFQLIFVCAVGNSLINGTRELKELQHSKKTLLGVQRVYSRGNQTIQVVTSPNTTNLEKAKELEALLPKLGGDFSFGDVSRKDNPELIELAELTAETKRHLTDAMRDAIETYRRLPDKEVRREHFISNAAMFDFMVNAQYLSRNLVRIEDEVAKHSPAPILEASTDLLVAGFAFNCFVSIAGMQLFTMYFVSRLRRTADNAQLIAIGKPLPPPDPRMDEIGELDRIISNAAEILADVRLKESAIFDSTAHVMCSIDKKLRIQTIGGAAKKAWHYAPEELLGKSLLSLIASTTIGETREQFDQITQGSQEGKIETVMRCGDGSFRNMVWNVSWRNNSFYCVVQDVTEMRNVEQLRQHFFSMASHDLRSPLTAVGMNIQLIAAGTKGPVSEEVVSELQAIEANLARVMNLVNEVLALEKLEAMKTQLALSAVNAADVCEAAKETLQNNLQEQAIRIKGPRDSALLLADEELLEKAITHLISGVMRFTDPGSGIFITVKRLDETVLIDVAQHCYQIPPAEADFIFDKLRLSHIEPDRPARKAGFGLALVKAIAELHGGAVGVDPCEQGGSSIWIAIPLHPEDST